MPPVSHIHLPVQQTTGGIGHRVKLFFRVGNQYNECEKHQGNKTIIVSVQCNGGFFPDIIILTPGHPFKCQKEVLPLHPIITLKCFDIFPLD